MTTMAHSQTVLYIALSSNRKTGPIPVTYSARGTCPDDCALKGECYGEDFFTRMAWNRVDAGRGISWSQYCAKVAALEPNTVHRMNVTGDLPRRGNRVDRRKVRQLTAANRGRRGYTYSHNRDKHSLSVIREANAGGFTINLSANSPSDADYLTDTGAGPVVTLLPHDAPKVSRTPAGRKIVVCPAQSSDNVTCATCGLCAVADRSYIIGFRAHGTRASAAERVIRIHSV